MALPDTGKWVDGTSFIFAFDTDWPASPTPGWSATVDAEIDLGSLVDDGYRESAKCDLTVNRAMQYKVEASIECDTDATAGSTVDIYAGFSDSATAGTGNPGGLAGADQTYAGGTGGTAATGVDLLEFVGSLTLQATQDTDIPQVGLVGTIQATGRYMMIVVHNDSGATLGSGGTGLADELAVRVTEQNLQTQD